MMHCILCAVRVVGVSESSVLYGQAWPFFIYHIFVVLIHNTSKRFLSMEATDGEQNLTGIVRTGSRFDKGDGLRQRPTPPINVDNI